MRGMGDAQLWPDMSGLRPYSSVALRAGDLM